GSRVYTRDGSFHLDASGNLVGAGGYVLDADARFTEDTIAVHVDSGGTVLGVGPDGAPYVAGRIETADFPNPAGLAKIGDNLYVPTPASGEAIPGTPDNGWLGKIVAGGLEASNVNVTREMLDMLITQRGYEANLRTIRTQDRITGFLFDAKK
ncbi:MAG: flagellar hook-basal body complex protein, partial [bacterium]